MNKVVLAIWYYRDRDLSVYPIMKKDAETTYWLAIVFSNSDFLTTHILHQTIKIAATRTKPADPGYETLDFP